MVSHQAVNETVQEYILDYLNRHRDFAMLTVTHEVIWGVPCGPTLGMIKSAYFEEGKRIYVTCPEDFEGMHFYDNRGICMYCGTIDVFNNYPEV